jgi:hypothetical protein
MTTDKQQTAQQRADLIARHWTPAPRPHHPQPDQDRDEEQHSTWRQATPPTTDPPFARTHPELVVQAVLYQEGTPLMPTPEKEEAARAAIETTRPIAARVIAAKRDGREAWISDDNNLDLWGVVECGTKREQYALIAWLAHLAVEASTPDRLRETLTVYGKVG